MVENPEKVMSATKRHLADCLMEHAHAMCVDFVAGYGSRGSSRRIHCLDLFSDRGETGAVGP
ncbi:hypothetical protein [Nonomuraea jabiensis]|uniref:hypothetical protein n=1 Tax=Nonomuraea jabiensis TaxID=882448 RepID=UPI003D713A16